MKAAGFFLLGAATLGLTAAAPAQTPLVQNSPFATGKTGADAPAPDEPYQLTGVVSGEAAARVCIYDAKARHGHWIAVGAAADGIEVVSYDAGQKRAVISVGGTRRTLLLREAAATGAAAPATTAEAKAKEARLLSGDLLEVGLEQRQAYAKAHPPAAN